MKKDTMTRMYNPDTGESVKVPRGREVTERRVAGFVPVGDLLREEYEGKTRDELANT